MYSVSNDYLTKMFDQIQTHKLSGSIDSVSFTDADVIGVSYTNRCSDKKVSLGSVNIGVLKLTFLTDILNRGEYYGKEIVLSDLLLTGYDENDDPVWESVPVGVFYVAEATWTNAGMVNVTAYDCLSKMDEALTFDQTTGKIYDFCSYIATQTGTTFGMTEEECDALPNGTEVMSPYEEASLTTWRDLLSSVAQMVGGFAYADRSGSWKLRSFDNTSILNIPKNRRMSGTTFSDFETYYDTILYTDIESKEVRVVGGGLGLSMNLGSQPFLQYGLPAVVQQRVETIVEVIKLMEYTPFDLSCLPAFIALDLGDVVTLTDDYSGDSSTGALMSIVWTYNKTTKMTCYGENPNLRKAQSASEKNIAGLQNQTTQNEVVYYTFSNLQEIEVEDEVETQIASLHFTAFQTTTVKIMHEFIMDFVADLASDCSYEIRYYLNDELVEYSPYERIGGIQSLTEGETTETSVCRDFFYVLRGVSGGVRHNWRVCIVTHGMDSTTIGVNHAHITLEGQRLLGESAFMGLIEVSDTMPLIFVNAISAGSFTDAVDLDVVSGNAESASDNFELLPFGGTPEADYILDEEDDEILDESEEPIEGEQGVISASVGYPKVTEFVTVSITTDEDFSAYVALEADGGMYVGEDLDAGMFNTLYEGGE